MKNGKRVISLMMAAMLLTGSSVLSLRATDITVSAAVKSDLLPSPGGLKCVKRTASAVTLSWESVDKAQIYAVYKYDSAAGKYRLYKKVSSTTCDVTGLKASTSYKFRVAAMKVKNGKLTAQTRSAPLTVKTRAKTSGNKSEALPGTGAKLSESEGKVFNIYSWNEEFKVFFEKYYVVPSGITVNWLIYPAADGCYQDKLDSALQRQSSANADDKVDMFLAEPDYICKYVDSDYTMDVSRIGVKPLRTEYQYTIDAATDSKGKLKGVSYLCCPGALIYRRSIAEEVLGTSDPDEVQSKLSTWDKFSAAAESAKNKGYAMTASPGFTYRVFSDNKETPWVDPNGALNIDSGLLEWVKLSKEMVGDKTTFTYNMWSDVVFEQMGRNGVTMCYFGPSWYYNYSMWVANDYFVGTSGDWAICQGPETYFWGGSWLLAAEGSDNPEMIADVMNAFTVNKDICTRLAVDEKLLSNNTAVNQKLAKDNSYGNDFLGGQNDYAVLHEIAGNIKYNKSVRTRYDMVLDDDFSAFMMDYICGYSSFDDSYEMFLSNVIARFPGIKIS